VHFFLVEQTEQAGGFEGLFVGQDEVLNYDLFAPFGVETDDVQEDGFGDVGELAFEDEDLYHFEEAVFEMFLFESGVEGTPEQGLLAALEAELHDPPHTEEHDLAVDVGVQGRYCNFDGGVEQTFEVVGGVAEAEGVVHAFGDQH
jgi:hypothetical protein